MSEQPLVYTWRSNEIQRYQSASTIEAAIAFVEEVGKLDVFPKVLILGTILTEAGFDRNEHQQVSMSVEYYRFEAVLLVEGAWDGVTIPMQMEMNSYSQLQYAREALQKLNLKDGTIYVNYCPTEQFDALFAE